MKKISKLLLVLMVMFIPFVVFNATTGKGIDSLTASYPTSCDT